MGVLDTVLQSVLPALLYTVSYCVMSLCAFVERFELSLETVVDNDLDAEYCRSAVVENLRQLYFYRLLSRRQHLQRIGWLVWSSSQEDT